jgi:type II secretory pathway component PulM
VLYVILAWVGAFLVTLVVVGFCTYELTWKLRRLRADTDKLQTTLGALAVLQGELAGIQQRAAKAGRPASAPPQD